MELGLDRGQHPLDWQEFTNRFLAHHAGTTAKRYARLLKRLADFMNRSGRELIHEATSLDLEAFEQARELSANSQRREIGQLRTIWAWALRHNIVSDNIAKRVSMPAERPSETQPFSDDELLRLESAIEQAVKIPSLTWLGTSQRDRLRALYEVMRTTGLRVSDVVRLRPEHIAGQHLVLPQTKTFRQVRLPLLASCAKALAAVRPTPAGYFFWTGNSFKAACDSVWRSFARLGSRAGVSNCHPHRLRDTFAVNLLLAGADIRLVSKLLGHSSIRTTERHYAPWVQAFQEQAKKFVRISDRRYRGTKTVQIDNNRSKQLKMLG